MMFSTIGTVYNAVKMTELSMKWQQRRDSGIFKPKENEDPEAARLREEMRQVRESNVIAAIDGKLKAGGELTDEELRYLKEKNPALYQEALEIKRERQQYKKALQACKTKEDVQKLKAARLQSFAAQCKAICSNANISRGEKQKQMDRLLRRMAGINNEHLKFEKTQQYQELPTEEELKKRKKKEAAQTAPPEQPAEETRPLEKPSDECAGTKPGAQEPDAGPEKGAQESDAGPEKGAQAGGADTSGAEASGGAGETPGPAADTRGIYTAKGTVKTADAHPGGKNGRRAALSIKT